MPTTTPYARLRASINGGAPTTGGITVAASATVNLSFEDTTGWTAYVLTMYPPGSFALPAGWTDNGDNSFSYTGVLAPPPQFTLPAIAGWGKWIFALVVNGGVKVGGGGNGDMTDTATALSMLSVNGLEDTGTLEETQFHLTKAWGGPIQTDLRLLDAFITAGGGGGSVAFKGPVRMASTANLTLSGLQTVDSVVGAGDDRVLAKNQTAPAENGPYLMKSGAWIRTTDADTSAEMIPGMLIVVAEGATNADKIFELSTDAPIVLGTTALTFTIASGGAGLSGATPQPVGTATPGASGLASDAGHVHAHGNQATSASALHADAVSGGNSGFMSGADKAALDALVSGVNTTYDLTTLTTQNFLSGGDGNKTLSNGLIVNCVGTAFATTWGITNGTGLTISMPAPASVNRNCSMFAGLAQFSLTRMRHFEIWLQIGTRTGFNTGGSVSRHSGFLIQRSTPTIELDPIIDSVDPGNGYVHASSCYGYVNGTYVPATAANRNFVGSPMTDDVWVGRFGPRDVQLFSGVYSSGWPLLKDLTPRGAAGIGPLMDAQSALFPTASDLLQIYIDTFSTAVAVIYKKIRIVQ